MGDQENINNETLVSVGIPTFNRPEGLRRTLECITNQTYKNLEIIVSDNCSPGPETEAIVREFMAKDPRIQYYRQERNKGIIYNFKFVLEKSNGEYFMWASDDDEWDEKFIDILISELTKKSNNFLQDTNTLNESCGDYFLKNKIAFSAFLYESKNIKKIIYNFDTYYDINKTNPYKLSLNAVCNRYWTYLFYGIYKRDFLNKALNKNMDVFAFDVIFILQLLLSTKIVYIPLPLYIKHCSEIDTEIKYKNEIIGKLYSDKLKDFKFLFNLGLIFLQSKIVPIRNKLFFPWILIIAFISVIKINLYIIKLYCINTLLKSKGIR